MIHQKQALFNTLSTSPTSRLAPNKTYRKIIGVAKYPQLKKSRLNRVYMGLAGNLVALWAIRALGAASTYGDEGALVRLGPYGFSRNLQYLGFIVALVGWGVMADSSFALIVSIVGTVPLVSVPFAEEPWLLARHGPAYEEYKGAVPRFISCKW